MSRFLLLGFLLSWMSGHSQLLNGYKYIHVPAGGNVPAGSVAMAHKVQDVLISMGMKSVEQRKEGQKRELELNPCLILTARVDMTVTMVDKAVRVTLSNCEGEDIYTSVGKASGLSKEKALNEAYEKSIESLRNQEYAFDRSQMVRPYQEINLEEDLRKYLISSDPEQIEGIYQRYLSDLLPLKIGIAKTGDRYKAVVLEPDETTFEKGAVIGYLEKSSAGNIYSAEWLDSRNEGQQTVATLENGTLLTVSIRNPSTGKVEAANFLRMFPKGKMTSKGTGSGFFISKDGFIGTNAHVVGDAQNIKVTCRVGLKETTYDAVEIFTDKQNDVSIIKIDDPSFSPLDSIPYGFDFSAKVGEDVFTIGFPLSQVMGRSPKVSEGIISSRSGINDDMRVYQITVPLQPGNSGGPLFSEEGDLLGLTTSSLNEKAVETKVENVNYAVKSVFLSNLTTMVDGAGDMGTKGALSELSLAEKVEVLQDFVCYIEVVKVVEAQ